MFKSKLRDRILPQYEHSQLAGMLAWHWGNAAFDRPALDFAGFARGVALHDWHYGLLDNHPLGEYDHAEWLAIADRGVSIDYADAVTDVVAKYHLRRLIGAPGDAETSSLFARLNAKIEARTRQTPYPPAAFEWADRITRFCDSVAFHAGFEDRGWHRAGVYASRATTDETGIGYEIAAEEIRFDPWPFSAPDFNVQITAFDAAGYPQRPEPRVMLIHCAPAG